MTRAGIATLQKESAADIRLQRVTLAEQALTLERQALDQRAAEIQRATTQSGAAQPTGDGTLPKGGQPTTAGVKQALDALLDSDTETAAAVLSKVVADQVELRMKAVAPALPVQQQTPPTAREIPAPWSQRDIQEANAAMDVAFSDIVQTPAAASEFTRRIVQEMQNPINRMAKVPLMQIAAQIGVDIRRQFTAPAQPTVNVNDELLARRSLAARVPSVPTSGAARTQPQGNAAPARTSGSAIVENMRKARGQSV